MSKLGPGSILFLCIGTGIGIALYSGPQWWWQGSIGALLIAIASIALRSEHYRDYLANCSGGKVEVSSPTLQKIVKQPTDAIKPNILSYLSLLTIQNIIVIFIVALVVSGVKKLI